LDNFVGESTNSLSSLFAQFQTNIIVNNNLSSSAMPLQSPQLNTVTPDRSQFQLSQQSQRTSFASDMQQSPFSSALKHSANPPILMLNPIDGSNKQQQQQQ
jgi:hypothetical protein